MSIVVPPRIQTAAAFVVLLSACSTGRAVAMSQEEDGETGVHDTTEIANAAVHTPFFCVLITKISVYCVPAY